jgi:NAD(P)-dependent dehydrogenase (short-subunit alcohol dehydrogenase family)
MCHHLIYGATGSIGSAVARALVKNVHTVHLAGRNEDKLKSLAEELKAEYSVGDIHDEAYLAATSQKAAIDQGAFKGLVFAVGDFMFKPAMQTSDDEILASFKANALDAMRVIRHGVPHIAKYHGIGSILLFSHICVQQGLVGHLAQSMAKGALEAMVKTLATEFAPKIRVNAIACSIMETPMTQPLLDQQPGNRQALQKLHPIQRLVQPDDLGQLANTLLTAGGDAITGQIFAVDGGRSTLRPRG